MTEQSERPYNGTYYTLEDKHFWAAFLNLARHNAYITLTHIDRQLAYSKADITNDEDILFFKGQWKNLDNDLERKSRLRSLILKHFSFLEGAAYGKKFFESKSSGNKSSKNKELTKKEKEELQANALSLDNLKSILFDFLQKLKDFRNYYSHYRHSGSSELPLFDGNMLQRLYNVFDVSVQRVKRDHEHNDEVDPHYHFNHLVRKGKKDRYGHNDNPSFKHHFVDGEGMVTEAGLLFFVSLFLEKRDAIWMQKKIRGFKGGTEPYEQMTNEVFCRSRISLPKLKLESLRTDDWMLLDMLNELVRCPKPLYDRLREKDRACFRVPVDILPDEDDTDGGGEDPFKNTLVRHQDRFPYFALRYFDLKKVFTSLRFHIDLGTYHFAIYKKMIGEQPEDRHLTRNLYGFGRIQDFAEEHRPEEWKRLVRDLDYFETGDKPYISQTTPHYHIEKGKIGLRFVPEGQHLWPSPEVGTTRTGRSKYAQDKRLTAEAFLSVHELMPMMFYYFLLREKYSEEVSAEKVQGRIKRVIEDVYAIYDAFARDEINTLKELDACLADKGIRRGHLPKQMIGILSQERKDMEEKVRKKLQEMIADTDHRLDMLDRQTDRKIRIGRKNAGLPKSGVIADWLVRDMMRFQPVAKDTSGKPLNNSKANSTEYRMLQRALALFGGEKERLTPYFRQMNLTGGNNPHPFLHETRWESHTNILSFYRSYLRARKAFLERIGRSDRVENCPFLLLKEPKTDRQTLVAGWKGEFHLPRGIFTEAVRDCLIEMGYDEVGSYREVGFMAKAVPLYFERACEDRVQPFYDSPFNVGNSLKPKKGRFLSKEKRAEEWESGKERFRLAKLKKEILEAQEHPYHDFKSWQKFERELRLVKNQDIITWMMCRDLMEENKVEGLDTGTLYLKDIRPNVQEQGSLNVLNRVKPMRLPVVVYRADSRGHVHKEEAPLATVYIEERDTKLLKQGNFKSFVKDRRLNGLFSFVDTGALAMEQYPISKLRVEYELAKYQTARVCAFEQTLELEESLLTRYPHLPDESFREMLESWSDPLLTKWPELHGKVRLLIAVRNAFSHNQYPMYDEAVFSSIWKYDPSSPDAIEERMGLNIAHRLSEEVKQAKETIERIIQA
ncbi:hypothetical protein HQ42_01095 [Porphyromonas gulae]|uniref:type VI-B CRISPR-associated RNA-guided ribonuclease Cas13b n=1 Tax=Porphyromonas gulae TaxID=111105 RepID=UPI00052C9C07|nr:type VI-B CRISPR-associated RNA-guided ribonuclease Cas13b [Porphyromonas gulae]KGO03389.1 hypothetical protein HQ42_01095 [Porphyromonas gulae]